MPKRLLKKCTHTTEIKRSKFIAHCFPFDAIEQVPVLIESCADPNATHNCWAYRLQLDYRFNDDGEPASTAGKPMLSAIDNKDFDGVLAVVTRYFGGIKLGAGGLVRAYSGVVSQCLDIAQWQEIIPTQQLAFTIPFAHINDIYTIINREQLKRIEETYTANGIDLTLEAPAQSISSLAQLLTNATNGNITFKDNDA